MSLFSGSYFIFRCSASHMNPAYQNHRNRKAIIYRVNLVTKNVNLFDLLCEKIYNSLWRIIINTKYILQEKAMRLKEGRNHHTYQVQEINTELNLERRLEALGLTTGSNITILNNDKKGAITVRFRGTRFAMGKRIADNIVVEEVRA